MKSHIYQFKNCFLLRNHQLVKEDLWVRDERIINPEPVFFEEKSRADVVLDCGGAVIAPGYIDLQINGGFGVDFSHVGDGVEAAVSTVARGVLGHGVTSFCPTVVTSSPHVYRKVLPLITRQNGSKKGAGILGVHVEGPFISKEKKGAHSVQHIRQTVSGFPDVLDVYGKLDNICLVTMAPEVDVGGTIIREFVGRGITVSVGHSVASLSDGVRAMAAGASFITHLFNAMLPFHHRDPGLVGLLTTDELPPEKTVFYGIIADGIHTHPAALRIAFRSHPTGLVLVTDAMSAMGLGAGTHFIGEQMVEIKDQKAVVAGTDTLCGSVATMDSCVRYFKKATGCSIVQALECATLHPARVLNITDRKGTLDFGSDADFILLDRELQVKATYIAGECVWESERSEMP